MKRFFTLFALSGLLALPAAAQDTADAEPLTVAVLPFDATSQAQKGPAQEAAVLLSTLLSTKPELWMVERAEIDKILAEQSLSLSGMTDPNKAVLVGKLLGADVLVTGRLIVTGDKMICVAKVMSTNTSRVFGEVANGTKDAALDVLAATLSDKVAALLAKQKAAFIVTGEDPAKWLAGLKKQIAGKKLPSVSVKIEEQDLSQTVIDPAVQTEFEKVLGELGFEVINPKHTGKPSDIMITGEGISQLGVRRGNLVSSRARVEIQAVRREDGKVLFTDRETTSAVDISPAIAGKSALQKAAKLLLTRDVAKLVE